MLRPLHLQRVLTSPLSRCRLPAGALSARLGVPLQVDPRLAELDFGDWENVDWDKVPRATLDRWAADPSSFAPPGGETGAALLARVTDMHADLLADATPCLVVSHGGPLRLLVPMLRGEAVDLLSDAPEMGRLQIVASVQSRGSSR